ncbi:unnamed protein product [Somion occarium]|uniref:DNA 3'-5' helicase n=1 Tax=Somion occarium TaxID=3059160 RepID=A0ABP1DCT7_9APHY
MDSPTFEEMARDCGFDPSDFDESYLSDSGMGPSQHDYTYAAEGDSGEYMSEIEHSSPCPPGRTRSINDISTYRQSYPLQRDINVGDCYGNNMTPPDDDTTLGYSDVGHNTRAHATSFQRPQSQWYQPLRNQPRAAPFEFQSRRIQPGSGQGRAFGQTPVAISDQHSTPTMASAQLQSRTGDNPGIRLRPVLDLPDIYRTLFKFGVFNAVQSECFDEVIHHDDNMVISSPTGSGKTVLFELSIIRMLSAAHGRASKCIYVAPTKALCSEKYRDWTTKFQPLGIKCCELTGDTVHFGKSAWGDARDASIIVTTAEKWDSLTRNWSEHGNILSQIQLFLVDEIHILNDSRGSTLEVVISRMKTRGTGVRFMCVSATVPNIQDVANWIGRGPNGGPAIVKEFGEEYRPCKLTRHIYGIPRKQDQNDFQFTRILDYRLYGILQQHSINKPILVFCATRKGVMTTAEQLLKEYEDATEKKKMLPWARPRRIDRAFHDKRLDKLAVCGIGVHHAGMTMDDRRLTEDLYLKGTLRVVTATSTLAVGVNLPAHTVVIKGVKMFQNNLSQEYSDLDIIQMMGRAGRPQFDTEGVAVILCETQLEAKYKALVQGQTNLESCLHKNLSEHINSEIGLGTITSIESAKAWLHNSFLFQRIQRNTRHYAIGKESTQTWQEKIDDMVTGSIKTLQANEMVAKSEGDSESLCSTAYGDIMSKYYVRQNTMSLILKLPPRASIRELLEGICASEEFSDIKIRSGEKQIYGKLRTHDDIRYKPKKIEKASDKIFLNIQAVLGGINLNDPEYKNGDNQPQLECITIFRHVSRIARALVEVAIEQQYGAQVKHGLELLRCLTAKTWEDRPTVLRQIEQIGEKSPVLAQFGISTLTSLRKQDTLRLEQLLNRRPPFGNELLASVKQLPEYFLEVSEVDVATQNGEGPVEVELSIKCGLLHDEGVGAKPKKSRSKGQDWTVVLTVNSDLDFVDFRRIPTRVLKGSKTFSIVAELTKPSQSLTVMISSETIAGIAVSKTYKPNVPHNLYPTMNTRPLTLMERDLEGLEDDPDFWNMSIDDDMDDVVNDAKVPIKDLTMTQDAHANTKIANDKHSTVPKKIPKGNYECNHKCKDKTSCRHSCCHEGVSKPTSKGRTMVTSDEGVASSHASHPKLSGNDSTVHQIRADDVSKVISKAKTKIDQRLQQLDDLHASTNVRGRLQLSNGKRIKIDDGKLDLSRSPTGLNLTNGKRKPAASFDVDFVDIRDVRQPLLPDVAELSDSDELPEPTDLLNSFKKTPAKRQKKTPTETDYSDSGFDSLIRAVDLPNPGNSGSSIPRRESSPGLPARSSPPAVIDLATPPAKKRKHDDYNAQHVPKRSKYDEEASTVSNQWPAMEINKSFSERQTLTSKKPALFLPDSGSEEDAGHLQETLGAYVPPGPKDDEDFVLDESLFDVEPAAVPSSSLAPSVECPPIRTTLQHSPSLIPELHGALRAESFNIQPREASATTSVQRPAQILAEPDDDSFHDDLAEFEDWLYNSGSVVIVDKLDD